MPTLWIRFVAFNVFWIITAILAKSEYISFLVLLFSILLIFEFRKWKKPFRMISLAALVLGVGFDFICEGLGVIKFYSEDIYFLPKWLIALWILFAWVVPYLLYQFKQRRLLISAMSAILGPVSYYSGISFGIVQITSYF